MFSSDRNIDTLTQFFQTFREFLDLKKQYLRLSITEKLVRLTVALLTTLIVILLSFVLAIFLGMALAFALLPIIGGAWAFVVSATVILILILTIIAFRELLIEKPLVRLISVILLGEDNQ